MVYEFLLNCFFFNDSASDFDLFVIVGEYSVQGYVSLLILHLFFCISTPNIREAIWKYMSYHN
jgi:hypothetical protein